VVLFITAVRFITARNQVVMEPLEAELEVYWDDSALRMNIGEVKELRWQSSRDIEPVIYCEGAAVAIIGTVKGGVRVRALEGGVDVITLEAGGRQTVCVVTVREELFMFAENERALQVKTTAVFELMIQPVELLAANHITYYIADEKVAGIVTADNFSVEVIGLSKGITVLVAEWRGRRTEVIVEVEDGPPRRIVAPYEKQYLHTGQETSVTVALENSEPGDEAYFIFQKEDQKNYIAISPQGDSAVITAVGEGEQYVRVSHPKAVQSKVIWFDVIPAQPPEPPRIEVSESPLLLRKDEVKDLYLWVLNGAAGDQRKFTWKVIENAYAIEVRQKADVLQVTGVKPGAAKIRIENVAVYREYNVMVVVE
jgi:hypothetical protein